MSEGVSVKAWNKALEDIEKRFENIEKQISELFEKLNKKVNESAWNKVNEELLEKIKSKVSVKAWEKSLEDIQQQFNELILNDLKVLDQRLDRTSSLISELMAHLNEKVDVNVINILKEKVEELEKENKEVKARVLAIEELIEDAKVSERQLKKLLESI